MKLFKNILWTFHCPTDVDTIAAHFVAIHVPKQEAGELDFTTAFTPWQDPWFAYRRMLGSIYGISACYKAPDDSPSKPGWNRKLWKKHSDLTTDELVEKVFIEVLNLLKKHTRKGARA